MKRFNVTGVCVPEKHYMVDISEKLAKIMEMIDYGDYFTINRARQYGKTTTLLMLSRTLPPDYLCISLSFEGIGETMFSNPSAFCQRFIMHISKSLEDVDKGYAEQWIDETVTDFDLLSFHIDKLCKDRSIVLIIDEVDKTSSNRVFLHFLGMLRSLYLANQAGRVNTFHSVILAGVYDIRNIKLKMINEGMYAPLESESNLYNSPWNIAADFKVDMSFSPKEIATMLVEYEKDHGTGMDIAAIADEIYAFSSGYPYLTTRICQCIDKELGGDWTVHGVSEAVKIMLDDKNTLFDDIYKNMENNKPLHDFMYDLLVVGNDNGFNFYNPIIDIGNTYGFLEKGKNNKTVVSNRIFEILMYDYFISKDAILGKRIKGVTRFDVVDSGRFDMELCLRKFAAHYAEIFNERDAEFIEREGRLLFLSYLKPLINGQGFYHIESELMDMRRMDIVVDFAHEQFIIELKLWRGEVEHERAYEQLAGYLRSKSHTEGYLLTFDFRKSDRYQPYAKWVDYDGLRIFDVVVN